MTVDIQKRDIRENAARFARRWAGTTRETAEAQTFWNEFFAIFGVDRKLVGQFELHARRVSTGGIGSIDLFLPQKMAVEHKSAGKSLDAAMTQLLDYLPSVPDGESPRLLVTCDFANFMFEDLETRESGVFTLADLPDHVDLFWWLAGHDVPSEQYETEEDLNFAATLLMRDLHDELLQGGYDDHGRRVWLTRILFCVFADDTGVWSRNLFLSYVAQSKADGSDLGGRLATLFQVLNNPVERRSDALAEDLAEFTYINGDIFAEQLLIAHCTPSIRKAILEVCRFDWSAISPAIFGSLFQEVMTPDERRDIGAHYTTEANILRTIRPLFLDTLEAELAAADSLPTLLAFHRRLASLTFFDPACGCGNFLVVSYREVRRLETATVRAINAKRATRRGDAHEAVGQQVADLGLLLRVRVDQFYGIEIEEFPARIASTALYLADHVANREASKEFGQYFIRFPIRANPHITVGNALELDWSEILPASRADYVYGNPPFIGFVWRSEAQKRDMARVMPTGTPRRIDYVLGWYAKALDYMGDDTRCAFVSTNSISQGEQAPVLALLLQKHAARIRFAHRTFAWTSEARGKAHVHVVIVGFDKIKAGRRSLTHYPQPSDPGEKESVRQINAYLVDGPSVVIPKRGSPLCAVPEMRIGSKPNDAGHLILDETERAEMPPAAMSFVRRLYGSRELLQNTERWCLWLAAAEPTELKALTAIHGRLAAVRAHRRASTNAATRATSATPALFWSNCQPTETFLAVPEVSSEGRRVVPMAYLQPDDIVTNKLYTISPAPLWLFGILQSSMFMCWARTVGGRLKSDISLSPGSVYNTFPYPDLRPSDEQRIAEAATAVLDARAKFPTSSLADLYDPLTTPRELVKAHDALDRVVESRFSPRKTLVTEADRLKVLFERYETLAAPLAAASKKRRKR